MELDAALGVPLPLSMSTEPEWEWPAVTLDILDEITQLIICYYKFTNGPIIDSLYLDPRLTILEATYCWWRYSTSMTSSPEQ